MKSILIFVIGSLLVAGLAFQSGHATKKPSFNVKLANINGELAIGTKINFQSGLLGEYYDSRYLDNGPNFRRIDSTINFDWPNGVPEGTTIIPDGTYSENWSGAVKINNAGNWTFITTSDDGVKLFIDGQPLIQNWTDHGPTENFGTLNLTVGWHQLVLQHYNRWSQWGIQATIKLEFFGPGQNRVVIPKNLLCVDTQAGADKARTFSFGGRNYKLKVLSVKRL